MARKYKRDSAGRFAGGGGGARVSGGTAPAKANGKRKQPAGVRAVNAAKRIAKNKYAKKVAVNAGVAAAFVAAGAVEKKLAGGGRNAEKRSQAAGNIARATLAAAKNANGKIAVAKKTGKNRYNVRSGIYN